VPDNRSSNATTPAKVLESWVSGIKEEAKSERAQEQALNCVLEGFGYTQTLQARYGYRALIVTIVLGALGVLLHCAFAGSAGTPQAAVTALVGGAALWLGFHQWRLARSEITLDKFYERLAATNDRRVQWWSKPREHPSFEVIDYGTRMYIHLEMDNLEYSIEKYRIGWMSSNNAYTTLRTFCQRCLDRDFRDRARTLVDSNIGYHPLTRKVVAQACTWATHPPTWYQCKGLTQCMEKIDPDMLRGDLLRAATVAADRYSSRQ
jgi:hypothetical protein